MQIKLRIPVGIGHLLMSWGIPVWMYKDAPGAPMRAYYQPGRD